MRLATLARYGTRAMVDLALCHERGAVPANLRDIAERQGVSYRYLEQIMLKLRASGLVRSVRGAGGGFVLARPASQITVAETVEALEGRISVVDCTADPSVCDRSSFCVTRQVWAEVAGAIQGQLGEVTLADLAARQAKMAQAVASAYVI